jgi:hypothetical protein
MQILFNENDRALATTQACQALVGSYPQHSKHLTTTYECRLAEGIVGVV